MASSQIQKESPQKKEKGKSRNVLLKPVPLYILVLILLPVFCTGYYFYHPNKIKPFAPQLISQESGNDGCATIIRDGDSGLIRPLLLVEKLSDNEILIPAKNKIAEYINQKKNQGVISQASVYINYLNTAGHIEINPDELYDPASMMKVPMLIIILRQAEINPGYLKQRFVYNDSQKRSYDATIKDKIIEDGKSYSVEDLLYYMIVYSDNKAFWLLSDHIDNNNFTKLTEDFDIPLTTDNKNHDGKGQNFIANVNSMSRFFRVLYNSSYLSRRSSQYALNLLTKSNYKEGLLAGIDPKVKVAHKFGERVEGGVAELHEFGIVYLKNKPYVIGVMTKGPNLNQLPEIVSNISRIAFEEMKSKFDSSKI
jgi:beta-lactamase class A